jgi:Uri superfamily endonuclease
MRGAYCLLISLEEKARIKVGALGTFDFAPGVYAYVGSALSGIEGRVGRHRRQAKKMRWHIDYLLAKANVMSVISIPTDRKSIECAVARLLVSCGGATLPVPGFGSSDCSCPAHLVFLGDSDVEWAVEELAMRVSMMPEVYSE